MEHHRWLEPNHQFHFQQDLFDGAIEMDCVPILSSRTNVHRQMDSISYIYGKFSKSSKKREREDQEGLVEEVTTGTLDAHVFEDADYFFENENEEDA